LTCISCTAEYDILYINCNILGTWHREIFRRTYGLVVEPGIWRTGSNQELREMYRDLDTVADIKMRSLEWIGHVVRMDQGRTVIENI
jgi:hypothetical protein